VPPCSDMAGWLCAGGCSQESTRTAAPKHLAIPMNAFTFSLNNGTSSTKHVGVMMCQRPTSRICSSG
jgi:hypothetical protein